MPYHLQYINRYIGLFELYNQILLSLTFLAVVKLLYSKALQSKFKYIMNYNNNIVSLSGYSSWTCASWF